MLARSLTPSSLEAWRGSELVERWCVARSQRSSLQLEVECFPTMTAGGRRRTAANGTDGPEELGNSNPPTDRLRRQSGEEKKELDGGGKGVGWTHSTQSG